MTTLRPTALVTGATAGIGAEFCRQLAASGHDLVVTARDPLRLKAHSTELTEAYGVDVEFIVADLTIPDECARVELRLSDAKRPITVLVNNAGFGLNQDFDQSSVDDEQRLLDILVTAPMRLSHAAIRAMLARRGDPGGPALGDARGPALDDATRVIAAPGDRTKAGTIINVSSIAAFAPLGSYSAAKSWLQSFSRWANAYYRPAGITVTALAPGFVRTEFHERMGVERASMAPRWLWLDVEPLVRATLRAAARGRAVVVPTARYRVISWIARALPMVFVTLVAKRERWSR